MRRIAADLEHDIVATDRRGTRNDAEDVRVHEEVLSELAPRAHVELPEPSQARLCHDVVSHFHTGTIGDRPTLRLTVEVLLPGAAASW